jgi:tRNA threonylcarbamoyladenosine biosynthesis protein TsaB
MSSPGERPLLALESSTSTGSVAVGTAGSLLAEISFDVRGGHSSGLLPAAEYALRSAGLEPGDLGGVVIGGGPGSFTGLRIAGATAKGMVQALEVPLYAYSGLMAAAAPLGASGRPVCALFDARGRDLFAACYRFRGAPEVILPPTATGLDDLPALLDTAGPPIFVGDGATRHREELLERFGSAVAPRHFAAPRAAALVWLAGSAPRLGLVADPSAWEPEYLRASGAERIAAARSMEDGRA